jgi:hypothetical protein
MPFAHVVRSVASWLAVIPASGTSRIRTVIAVQF